MIDDNLFERLTDLSIGTGSKTPLAAIQRIEELEANLAKAVDALGEAIYLLDPDDEDVAKKTGLYRIVTTFKELKGETDDRP